MGLLVGVYQTRGPSRSEMERLEELTDRYREQLERLREQREQGERMREQRDEQ